MSSKNIKKINNYLEKILNESLDEIVSERFARYSKYIIQDRALPDARDGLKPVQRRILYAMNELQMFHNKPYKKSARIAGEVMGKYHPHGDSSIYDAMVRMSQDFKMLVPLIDMHGNNGSIDGDSAAAMRYTEARLSLAAEFILKDIDKKTVSFVPNFDDEELEPTVLPSKFPNILVNGSKGISAGYATNIPPHNLVEVINATIAFLENDEISDSRLISYIKGPDFPTGGIVQGKDGIKKALKTGSGKIIIRAKTLIEEVNLNQDRIVISEIPFELNKAELVRSIDNLRIDKKIEDILEIRDESDQEGMRIAIDLKKGCDANLILAYLFKNTDLQISYSYNITAILNRRPYQVGIRELLKAYIEHQKDVITNRSNFELERAKKREHIVEGLIKMVSILDEIILIIRKSKNKSDSKENIKKRWDFSEIQAEAIVTLQLYRLSNTDIMLLEKEAGELKEKILFLNKILSDELTLRKVIKDELLFSKEKLGQKRKTTIEDEIENIKINERELISNENTIIGITKDGYLKRSNLKSYNSAQTIGLKNNDGLIFLREVSNLDTLLVFTNLGNYLFIPVFKISDQKWKDLGIFIGNIVPIKENEKIVSIICVNQFSKDIDILFASKQGNMKQVNLKEFEVTRYSKTIRCMKLDENDELVAVNINQKDNIIAISKKGYALRFKTDNLPKYGSSARGVNGMSLANDDFLVEAFYAFDDDEFITLTQRGHIIKNIVGELNVASRARRGVKILETLKNNPHFFMSAARVSKIQEKENVKVILTSNKAGYLLNVNDLKYTYNKFGKKIIENNDETGIKISIDDAKAEVGFKVLKQEQLKEKVKIVKGEKEIEIKDKKEVKPKANEEKEFKKPIYLSRLDLDDE